MQLFSEYVAWQNYAATKLTECEIEETKAEADVRRLEAQFLVTADPRAKVTAVRAAMGEQEVISKARDRVIDAYAARKMTGVIYTNCERVVNLLSRELTRRVGREPTERRSMRWAP